MSSRWVCVDIGEVLVDETRVWATWARLIGVTPLSLHALLGAMIATGREHTDAFGAAGVADWMALEPRFHAAYGAFQADDLYPDALASLVGLRDAGYGVAVVGNQPARRSAELRTLGVDVDVLAMSDELGAAKPDPAFFTTVLDLLGGPDPGDVAYVGDRVDNDVEPAATAGLRPVRVRRGPWGLLQPCPPGVLEVGSLDELVERVHAAFR